MMANLLCSVFLTATLAQTPTSTATNLQPCEVIGDGRSKLDIISAPDKKKSLSIKFDRHEKATKETKKCILQVKIPSGRTVTFTLPKNFTDGAENKEALADNNEFSTAIKVTTWGNSHHSWGLVKISYDEDSGFGTRFGKYELNGVEYNISPLSSSIRKKLSDLTLTSGTIDAGTIDGTVDITNTVFELCVKIKEDQNRKPLFKFYNTEPLQQLSDAEFDIKDGELKFTIENASKNRPLLLVCGLWKEPNYNGNLNHYIKFEKDE